MNKACPVVLRQNNGKTELLVFRHPLAGCQVVKGTIESGETLEEASVRELYEESGLRAEPLKYIGTWNSEYEGHIWGFYAMSVQSPMQDEWTHFTEDGGGLDFSFYWQDITSEPDEDFHPLFKRAIRFIQQNYSKVF